MGSRPPAIDALKTCASPGAGRRFPLLCGVRTPEGRLHPGDPDPVRTGERGTQEPAVPRFQRYHPPEGLPPRGGGDLEEPQARDEGGGAPGGGGDPRRHARDRDGGRRNVPCREFRAGIVADFWIPPHGPGPGTEVQAGRQRGGPTITGRSSTTARSSTPWRGATGRTSRSAWSPSTRSRRRRRSSRG